MPFSHLFTERIHLALESTRGTPITTPTHSMNGMGVVTPAVEFYEPNESRGQIMRIYRQTISRVGSAFAYNAPADPNYLPVWLNMGVVPETSPSTPAGGTLTRLWECVRTMNADDIKAASIIWDLDVQSLITDYNMLTSLTLSNNANNTEGLTVDIAGTGGFPSDIATPSPITNIAGVLLPGQKMQLWVDDIGANPIGTTAYAGTIVSASHALTTGVTFKHLGNGPTATLEFSDTGRDPGAARMVTTFVVELANMTLYDLAVAGTKAAVRIRHNGAAIETVAGPLTYYNYVEVDTYGALKNPTWGTNVNSNRTLQLTVESIVDSTLAADFRIAVQNARTSLG